MQVVDHKGGGMEFNHSWDIRKSVLHLKTPGSVVSDFHQLKRGFLMLFPKSLSRPRRKLALISGNLSDQKVAFLDPAILISATDQGDRMTFRNKPSSDMD
jgi:hypothetical protein